MSRGLTQQVDLEEVAVARAEQIGAGGARNAR